MIGERARTVVLVASLGLAGCPGGAGPAAPSVVTVPVQPPPQVAAAPERLSATDAEPPSVPVAADAGGEPRPFVSPVLRARATPPTPKVVAVAPRTLTKVWSARIGKTTFRTTMALDGATVVVGTHGDTLDRRNEPSDGVYVVDARTGKVVRRIPTPGQGDRDVSGVAIDGGSVVFATDNGQVVKARLADGALVWTAKVSGKARPAPALADLDGKGALDVVVGDEAGTLHALDGDKGTTLWSKKTDKNEYDARGFVAAAAVTDVDGDGKDDVIAGARDGNLVAYRGSSGDVLWSERGGSGIHASPSLVDMDGDGRLEVLSAWSYSQFMILDAKTGEVRYHQDVELDGGGIDGLFASPVPLPVKSGPGLFVQGTAWWSPRNAAAPKGNDGIVLLAQKKRAYRSEEGRVTATPVVLDLGDDGLWDAVVGTEVGELLAVRGDGTKSLLAKLGGGIEASALVADVDADGTYELLVASNDGLLTCFATGSKTRPLVPRFRGATPDNRGSLGAIPLGWAVSAPSP